jgi:hypothetical protein
MTSAQEGELCAWLDERFCRSTVEIRARISKEFGLDAHSETSGRLFRQHPVSHSGVSGHLRIVAAKAWFLMSGRETFVNFFCCLDRAAH